MLILPAQRKRRRRRKYRKTRVPADVLVFCGALFLLCALLLRTCSLQKDESPPVEMPSGQPELTVYDDESERCFTLGLEDYIVGVVAGEMPASFEAEALKAQTVAARTYTLRRMEKPCGREGAQICTDSACCQAYRKDASMREGWGASYKEYFEKIRAAVAATAGEALYFEGELIEALYHSSAGGMTEDAQHVFAQARPYLVSVPSPGEEVSAAYDDTVRVSRKSFAKTVNRAFGDAKLKAASLDKQVKVLSRFDSGRVETVKLGKAEATGRELRKLFDLNSANFTLDFTNDAVLIRTLGYGHGVGMSQYGANAMAKEGADYKTILAHYYAGITIEKAY